MKKESFKSFIGGNYGNIGLDLKRHIDDHSIGSPSSTGESLDNLQEPEPKRPRSMGKYDAE
nr:unnamed protein product [Callosobruchus chinensis]